MRIHLIVLASALVVIGVSPASAQRRATRTPSTGMWAVGGSIGPTSPSDASLDNGVDLVGNAEYYVTPRVSVRGQLGGARWDVLGRGFNGRVSPLYVDGNVVYNWEGGVIHPFVTGGLGLYRFGSQLGVLPDASDTHLGVNGGGGLEYFVTRRASITGELLFHKVDAFSSPLTTFGDGSFWSFSAGAKIYFPAR
jgi:outer membrane protein with beta-barrel domain